jgi:hypothetical protein
MKQINT